MLAHRAHAQNLAALLLAGVALSACGTASMHPNLSSRPPENWTPPKSANNQPSGKGGTYKVGKPYQVAGIWYVPKEEPNYDATGVASWYGQDFHQKATANGEVFDMHAVSAAHTTLPMPSIVEVTNLDNGKKIQVRLNDRGPFIGGRIIDLSYEAARQLDYDRKGLANVRVRYVGPAPLGVGEGARYAASSPAPAAAPVAVAAAPLPPAPAVTSSSLPPVTAPAKTQYAVASPYGAAPASYAPTARNDYRPPAASTYPPYSPPRPAAASASSSSYRVQAGAFSDPGRAQQVANQLAGAGPTRVESVQRDTGTVYRVVVQASADEAEAWDLRDKVASLGYADARVLGPF